MDSDATVSADESEDVDILSDFPPELNISQSHEPSTSARPTDTTDSDSSSAFFSTFYGDHNYCCTSVPMDTETGESALDASGNSTQKEEQSGQEIPQSGYESSPKVIIESQQGEQVSNKKNII
jgi:hypothetical protein